MRLSSSSSSSMSIESVMPSSHLILCRPLLLPPSVFPSIRVFSSELALRIRWPQYWSFSLLCPLAAPCQPRGLCPLVHELQGVGAAGGISCRENLVSITASVRKLHFRSVQPSIHLFFLNRLKYLNVIWLLYLAICNLVFLFYI